MQDTETVIAESEKRLAGYVNEFEHEEKRLSTHRASLIKEREKTDRMLARVRRTIASLKPPEEQPRSRKAVKAKASAPAEYVTEAKRFAFEFFGNEENEFFTTAVVREHFSDWPEGRVHAVMGVLKDERFLRVAGVGHKGQKQYKLTAEAKGADLALVA